MWKKIIAVLVVISACIDLWVISLPNWAVGYFTMLWEHRSDFTTGDILQLCDLNFDGIPELFRQTPFQIDVYTIRDGKGCYAGSFTDLGIRPYQHNGNDPVLWVSETTHYFKYGYDSIIGFVTLDGKGKIQIDPVLRKHEYCLDSHECYYEHLGKRITETEFVNLYSSFYERLSPVVRLDYCLKVGRVSGTELMKWLCSYENREYRNGFPSV